MMENANSNWVAMSDGAIIAAIGEFIKHKRLQENKTQAGLARDAGLNRSTLVQIEKGESVTLSSLIQVMRAFMLKKGEKWKLAPAYDVCYSYDPSNIWVNQQTLSVNGKHKDITGEDLMTIAKANNIKNGSAIIDKINQTVNQWEDFAEKVNVKKELREDIQANLHVFK